jgi:DNA-binding NtrC family response regulator
MGTPDKILVVGMGQGGQLINDALRRSGLEAAFAPDADGACSYPPTHEIKLVIVGPTLRPAESLRFMERWRSERGQTPFLLIFDPSDRIAAAEALEQGADGYIIEPTSEKEVAAWIEKCLRNAQHKVADNAEPRSDAADDGACELVAQSKVMRHVLEQAKIAARSDAPLLVMGEPGTGKTVLAAFIHANSDRRTGPFVVCELSVIPARQVDRALFGLAGDGDGSRAGQFQKASNGTLFVEDVAELATVSQIKLAQIYEGRAAADETTAARLPRDVRLIGASARNLHALASNNRFSPRLLRVLAADQIRVPPLRERREDIPLLVDQLLRQMCERMERPKPGVEPELMRFLQRFDWPGNVRQLRDCLETMLALSAGDVLHVDEVPANIDDLEHDAGMYFPAGTSLAEMERSAIEKALAQCNGNRTQAAGRLGISVRTLQRKLKTWRLESEETAQPFLSRQQS